MENRSTKEHSKRNRYATPVSDKAIRLVRWNAHANYITQQQLADFIGMSRFVTSTRLNGRSPMTLAEYVGMCERIGVRPGDLLNKAQDSIEGKEGK